MGSTTQTHLSLGGNVCLYKQFLSDELCSALATELQGISWVTEIYNMYGKDIPTPRLLSSMFDVVCPTKLTPKKGKPYWNEDTAWVKAGTRGWTPIMKHIKEYIEATFNVVLPYAQMNWYRASDDYIGWHRDREMSSNDFVFSISIGATRRFGFRDGKQKSGPLEYEVQLGNGDLILFDANAGNVNYKHSLVKARVCDKYVDPTGFGRFNITFRTINA